jgi:hypothetical protein
MAKRETPTADVLALRSQVQDGRRGHQTQTHRGGRGGGLGWLFFWPRGLCDDKLGA